MYKRYYRKYNNEDKPIEKNLNTEEVEVDNIEHIHPEPQSFTDKCNCGGKQKNIFNIFKNLKLDDIILLALIFIFLQDCVEDEMILMVLVFLFICGI